MTGSVDDTVIDSQVFLPLQLLRRRGIAFDLVLFATLRGALREGGQKRHAQATRARAGLSPGRVHVFWTVSPRRRAGLVWCACLLIGLLIPDLLRRRIVICHCRGLDAAAIARRVSQLLPGVRYLYDVRGDSVAEETLLLDSGNSSGSLRDSARELVQREARAVDGATVVTCVSGPLKRTIMARHHGLCPEAMLVLPCAAHADLFGFDSGRRAVERQRLGLDGLSVLIYAGAIGPAWHGVGGFMRLVSSALQADERRAFLCVTPETSRAQELATAAAVPAERSRFISVGHDGVAGLMMAADIGLLIRPVSPVNVVACPTKLAEYLVSGLVVLYSPSIGDTEALVTQFGVGSSVPPDGGLEGFAETVSGAEGLVGDQAARSQRSQAAAEYLSWERFLQARRDAYSYAAGLSAKRPSTAFYDELIG